MNAYSFCAASIVLGIGAAPVAALAEAPNLQWGSDERGMSQQECMKRAKFAMGEQGLTLNTQTSVEVLGVGPNVAVLVTCKALGGRTFISVIGASPDGALAGQFRNGVRSLVMGPAS